MDALTTVAPSYDYYVALDVDKNNYSVTISDVNHKHKSKKMPARPDAFYNYIQKTYPDKRILFAYEAGPTGYHLYDYLASHNERCLVISPNSIPKASNDKVKTNRLDSDKLTNLVKSNLVESIRVPNELYRELRHLANNRQNYASKQKIAKQQIESLLLFENLHHHIGEHSRWSRHHIEAIQKIPCNPAVRFRLDSLLNDLSYARGQLLNTLGVLKHFCDEHAEIKRNIDFLESIPGIGFITASYVLSRIGDPSNLRNIRELAAFAGVVPTERSTGDVVHKGHITHMGDETLRYLLIEAAWTAIRKDKELKFFYDRLKNKNPVQAGARKAIVAVARKLTHRIYRVLKEQRAYVVR